MRGIFVVVSMSLLLGVCISQAGSRRTWEQEDSLKPRPKQQGTADETNAVKDGPRTEQVLFGQRHMTTPCDLVETPGEARIVALAPNPGVCFPKPRCRKQRAGAWTRYPGEKLHSLKRETLIRNLEALASGEPHYTVQYEIGSECQVSGLLDYADGEIICAAMGPEESRDGL